LIAGQEESHIHDVSVADENFCDGLAGVPALSLPSRNPENNAAGGSGQPPLRRPKSRCITSPFSGTKNAGFLKRLTKNVIPHSLFWNFPTAL